MQALITNALIVLSKHRVGVKECAVLFICRNGATVKEIAELTGDDGLNISSRITHLKRKHFIGEPVYDPDGKARYFPTPAGHRVIEAATTTTTNQ